MTIDRPSDLSTVVRAAGAGIHPRVPLGAILTGLVDGVPIEFPTSPSGSNRKTTGPTMPQPTDPVTGRPGDRCGPRTVRITENLRAGRLLAPTPTS